MQHRLQSRTRHLATAVSLTAAAAAVDVAHTGAGATWAFVVAALLTAAAVLVMRLHEVALVVEEGQVELRGILHAQTYARDEVLALEPGRWRSHLLLADGTRVPTLLRDVDLDEVAVTPTLIDLNALAAA